VNVGTWYALRLESIGSRLRAYVNGNLVLEATDSTHARGEGGLVMYRTAAQFDDYRAVQP
jgi:pectate lyase